MANTSGINVTPIGGEGAKLTPEYHELKQHVVGVPVMEIKDATASAKEEVAQFSIGGFLFSGAFWLGIERFFTVGYSDTLFGWCIAFVICGAVLGIVGLRQTIRRVSRLERYIPVDDA